jgi:hypothetical protein
MLGTGVLGWSAAPMSVLYVAITNHGFGHATRLASVIAAIQKLYPTIQIIVSTNAPRWLLASYIPGDFVYHPCALDVGVVQSDSLTMDKAATLAQLRQIRAQATARVAAEADFIRQHQVGLILADIPPLATLVAQAAGIPCWMSSNFGWDFIYRAWGGEFVEMADWMGDCFSRCDQLFRLPFYEPMSRFPVITDVGLTGGTPGYDLQELQDKFGLCGERDRTVLLTFGGLGLDQIPYGNLVQFPDWQFITFDEKAPDLPNLFKINRNLYPYRPVDFMPLCGRVISKPGYGTFAEACRVGVPIVSVTRDNFAEAAVLIEGIQNYAQHQVLTPHELTEGNWEFLHQAPQPPRQSQTLALDGNEVIAHAVGQYFQGN